MSTKRIDADHYESLGRFVSAPGAATARLVPELGEYIVLAPVQKSKPAEVLVFQVSQTSRIFSFTLPLPRKANGQ
jgi:hypothetical protein